MSIIHKLPYEWQVGLRYTRAGKRSGRSSFISFISLISVAGIALGVAALIIVLSVMNGFQKQVTDRMLSVLAHIEVFDASGSLPDWRASAQEALRNPNVLGAAPFVETQGLLVRDGVMRPSIVRGVLPGEEDKVSTVARNCGIKIDRRKFRPHVTLARFPTGAETGHHIAQFMASHSTFRAGPWIADHFALYSSRRSSAGSVYREEAAYALTF